MISIEKKANQRWGRGQTPKPLSTPLSQIILIISNGDRGVGFLFIYEWHVIILLFMYNIIYIHITYKLYETY